MLFKYSGNKWKILPLLGPLPLHKRCVEPYLGSGAFLLSNTTPGLGIDCNPNIVDMWKWLQVVEPSRLYELEKIRIDAVRDAKDGKPDVRSLGLSKPEEIYIRVNVTGVYVGQLSSWKIYPKWKLPIEQTIQHLARLQQLTIQLGHAHIDYSECDGDLVFLDPPYTGTKANYKQDAKNGIEECYDPEQTNALISRIHSPIIFTYGTNAREVFPQYEWKEVLRKKVPLIRKGGTIERIEHVTFLNWNKSDYATSAFE